MVVISCRFLPCYLALFEKISRGMSQEHADRLVKYCQQRTGAQVRSIIRYTKSDHEVSYLRDDLKEEYSRMRLTSVVKIGRKIHRIRSNRETDGTPLGRPEASIRIYENAIVLQLPVGKHRGVLATFDRSVGSNLLGFIEGCQDHVLK